MTAGETPINSRVVSSFSLPNAALLPSAPDTPAVRDPAHSCEAGRMNGDEFAARCGPYLDQVWRQLRAMGVHESQVDDATQEVFLIAHSKIEQFQGRAQLGTWLYAIAYRVGCNFRRKVRRETASELDENEYRAVDGDPEQSLRDKRAAIMVERFCAGLSEKLRDVFVLCLLEQQPASEVAQILGVPENTVYSRVRIVRAEFRRMLEERELS